MVNTEKLKKLIKDKGYTYTGIGKEIGVTYVGIRKKIDNASTFKGDEIYTICNLLDLNDWQTIKDIFFIQNVAWFWTKQKQKQQSENKNNKR